MTCIQTNNSVTVITSMQNGTITVNGTQHVIPPHVLKKGNSISTINGKVYINGYAFDPIKGTFKRTLKALWYFYT